MALFLHIYINLKLNYKESNIYSLETYIIVGNLFAKIPCHIKKVTKARPRIES